MDLENKKDISEGVSSDTATEASLLAAIVESSDDAIIGETLGGIIMSWNKGAERQYGYTAKEAIGSPTSLLVPKNRVDELPGLFTAIKKGEPIAHYETERLHKDGRIINVSVNLSPIRDSMGNVIGAAAISRSITERKHAAQYTRSIIEASLDPLLTISPEGKITDVNSATTKMTGVTREELIGTDFFNYFTEPEKAREGYQRVFKEGSVTDYPLTVHNKIGKLTDVFFNASVYKDEVGNVLGISAVARDVTASKQALFYARSVIEAGLDPMITISPEGKITDVNEATARITGVSREKLIGSDFINYFTDKEEASQGNQQVFKEGFVREYPLIVRHASGSLTDVLYNASVYKDDKGNVFGAIAALRDITDQKKVEGKLHETSAYARSLIEASLDPLFIINPDGKISGVNHATEEITGVTREWLVDTDFSTYFTEPHKARDGYRQVLKQGEVRDYPLSIHNASGKITDVSFNASVYKDALGMVRGIFAAARDVTETRKASLYARSLIEASLDPLVTISPEGKVTDVNEATVRITGVPREELIGTDFLDYFTNPKEAREGYEKVFKQGFVIDYPLTIRSREGKLTDVLYNASVYKDEKGTVLGVFASARDNTRVKKETADVVSTSREMEAFSGSASHDLRAPLRVIDGFAQMLLEDYSDKLDDTGKQIISNIRTSSMQMRKLIDDLLVFSRLGGQELKKEYVAMSTLVQGAFDELKRSVPNRNISCVIPELPDSRADKDTLRLVWLNLLSNAIKYTGQKENAVIEVGSKVEQNQITYYVKDNGVGFDMKYIDKLFNIFQRLHSIEDFEGTGVGLANIKRIIERHGGKAWAEGKVGEGAVFYFTLPKV